MLRLIAGLSGCEWRGGGGGAALLARESVPLSQPPRSARVAVLGDTAVSRAGGSLLLGWMAHADDAHDDPPPSPSIVQVVCTW